MLQLRPTSAEAGQQPEPVDEMEHDQEPGTPSQPASWHRNKSTGTAPITKTDRVSRPRSLLVLRPLSKTSIREIPKSAFANLIGTTAPQAFHSEIASHKYDAAANCLYITVYDNEHAARILATTQITVKQNGKCISIPVEVKKSPHRPNTTRGVITVEPEDTNDDIFEWLRCEHAEILSAHRIGKTNRAVVTFDSPTLPKSVKYYMAIIKVSPYVPKRMVCYNCHRIGHMAKYCPSQTVCRTCGRPHDENEDCGPTVYCAACDELGHLAVSSDCPSRLPSNNTPVKDSTKGISWADRIRPNEAQRQLSKSQGPCDSQQSPTYAAILSQLAALREEVQQLKTENQELKKALAEKNQNATKTNPTKPASRNNTRPSRSPGIKRTPTSQTRIDPELTQALHAMRTDIQRERTIRQDDIGKIRTLLESHMRQTTAILQRFSKELPPTEAPEEPPRKVAPRNTLVQQ